MTTKQIIITVYVVIAVITAWYISNKLGGEKRYRYLFASIAGICWPIPMFIAAWLFVEGILYEIVKFVDRK